MKKVLLIGLLVLLTLCMLVGCDGSVNAQIFNDLPGSVKFFWRSDEFPLYYEFSKEGGLSEKYYDNEESNAWVDYPYFTVNTYSFSSTLNFNIGPTSICYYSSNDFLTNITSYIDLVSLEKMYQTDGSDSITLVNLEKAVVYYDSSTDFTVIFIEGGNACYIFQGDTLGEATYSISSNGLVVDTGSFQVEMYQNEDGTNEITSFETLKNLITIYDDQQAPYTQIFNYAD